MQYDLYMKLQNKKNHRFETSFSEALFSFFIFSEKSVLKIFTAFTFFFKESYSKFIKICFGKFLRTPF